MRFGKRHALFWGPFFVFIVAFVLHIRQMYVMFAALGLLAPISYLLGRRKLQNLSVSRNSKTAMTAGQSDRVSLTVRNDGSVREFFFTVEDDLPDGLESPDDAEIIVPELGAENQKQFTYRLLARRRGVYELGPSKLTTSDHLGLYNFTRMVGNAVQLIVYPRPVPIPDFWPQAVGGRKPQKPSRRRTGTGTDLYGLRDYQPGDDLRRIAWKATAKRDRMTVIETEHSQGMEAVIALDLNAEHHAGSGDNSTIEYAVTIAASLASEAIERGCNVGLLAHGNTDYSVPISDGPQKYTEILQALAHVQPDGDTPLESVIEAHEQHVPRGAVVAVISPTTSPHAQRVAQMLAARQTPVVWFALAPHTFHDEVADSDRRSGHEALLSRLTTTESSVVPVSGELSVEANLREGRQHGGD